MPTNGIGYLNNSLQGFLGRKHQAGMLESQQAQQQSMHEDSQAESALVREENRDLTMKGWERADVREKQSLAQQLTLAKAHMQQQQQQEAVRQREKMIEQAVELAKASDTNTRFSSEGALNRESEEKRTRMMVGPAWERARHPSGGANAKDPVEGQLKFEADKAGKDYRAIASGAQGMNMLMRPEYVEERRAAAEKASAAYADYVKKRGVSGPTSQPLIQPDEEEPTAAGMMPPRP